VWATYFIPDRASSCPTWIAGRFWRSIPVGICRGDARVACSALPCPCTRASRGRGHDHLLLISTTVATRVEAIHWQPRLVPGSEGELTCWVRGSVGWSDSPRAGRRSQALAWTAPTSVAGSPEGHLRGAPDRGRAESEAPVGRDGLGTTCFVRQIGGSLQEAAEAVSHLWVTISSTRMRADPGGRAWHRTREQPRHGPFSTACSLLRPAA
jgi:hypothetical protein